MASSSLWMTRHPERGVVMVVRPIEILGPLSSLEQLKLELSSPLDDKIPHNGHGQCHVSDPFLNCGAPVISMECVKLDISNLAFISLLTSTSACITDYLRRRHEFMVT